MEHYKGSFQVNGKPRLPKRLVSKEDTELRLHAIYSLAVKARGHECLSDKNTVTKIKQVASWLHDIQLRGLLLRGTPGNGKTTMLNALDVLFENNARRVGSRSIYEVFRRGESMEFVRDRCLLIDDLGAEPERCSVYGIDYHPLSDVIIFRYEHNLTTVIATNLSNEELRSRYGDRVYDRMIEMFYSIEYDDPSYRGIV